MRIIGLYTHGSADSVDNDVVYVLEEIPEFNKCKMVLQGFRRRSEQRLVSHNPSPLGE